MYSSKIFDQLTTETCLQPVYSIHTLLTGTSLPRQRTTKSWSENIGRMWPSTSHCMARTSRVPSLRRMCKSGTSTVWTPSWTQSLGSMGYTSLEWTLPTSTLGCGRPALPGTQRTWTSIVSTTSTLVHLNNGGLVVVRVWGICILWHGCTWYVW